MIKSHFQDCEKINNYVSNGFFYNGQLHCFDPPVRAVGFVTDGGWVFLLFVFVFLLSLLIFVFDIYGSR